MLLSNILLLASTASALSFSDLWPRKDSGSGGGGGKCPAVWTKISKELTKKFLEKGQCNDWARAAIREVFHDCGAWNKAQGATGGCDGSLILAPEELARGENKGLEAISAYLKKLAEDNGVGIADMIVFAGNHATVTCPLGPRVKTYVGRKDSNIPAPDGLLPDVNAAAADLFKLFQQKGFDERDLAALLGAHSTAKQFNFNKSRAAAPQDSTPGVWDVKYYSETFKPPKDVLVLPSDIKLAKFGRVGKEFQGFQNNQGKWNGKYEDAMERMVLFGSKGTAGLIDCTDALPKSTNSKRELKAMPVGMPRN